MRDRPGWKSQGWGQSRETGGCGRLRRQKREERVGSLSLEEAHTKGTGRKGTELGLGSSSRGQTGREKRGA